VNSFVQTVATPRKWPGRCPPSSPRRHRPARSRWRSRGKQLGGRRREDHVDAARGGATLVALEVARVRVEVLLVGELRGIDEDARDDDVALGPGGQKQAS
jgi:hypothetical protein